AVPFGRCGSRGLVDRMCDVIRHRGPDDEGVWVEQGVALGMRRLSIIDLSTGHQPIHNEDRTIWIVFNGEIYNFRELRRQLEAAGHRFYTATDTEAIVHAYEQWGTAAIGRLRGMFGLAIWDARTRTLLLARDRTGSKPPPGHLLTWTDGAARIEQYWRLPPDETFGGSEGDAVAALRDVLTDAVRSHLVSDVPLGAFLSGGVDSSTVVGLMAQTSGAR